MPGFDYIVFPSLLLNVLVDDYWLLMLATDFDPPLAAAAANYYLDLVE